MNRRQDELGGILETISKATRFMRSYIGQVLDDQDELKRGRVRICVPELGWFTPVQSPWVEPEYGAGHTTPIVGAWVIVSFMSGDVSRPVYRGKPGEVSGTRPASYSGPKDCIIFEDGGVVIRYDRDSGIVSIDGDVEINLNGSSKTFVTHAELDAALQTFVTNLNLLFGTKLDGGGTVGSLILDISSAATTTVKTGG